MGNTGPKPSQTQAKILGYHCYNLNTSSLAACSVSLCTPSKTDVSCSLDLASLHKGVVRSPRFLSILDWLSDTAES